MPKDLFTLKKTIPLYNEFLSEAKVNKIIEPTKDTVVFTLYNKKVFNLILSTSARYNRISLTDDNHTSPKVAPNFCMLLRKYLLGATITSVSVANDDRIVLITLVNENDFKEYKEYNLYLELMGKYSNLFLTANGVILGSLKSTPQNLENVRLCLTGAKYNYPPKQNKISVFDKDKALQAIINTTYPLTCDFILQTFLDFAPITAKELEYFLSNYPIKTFVASDVYNAILDFINTPICPTIISSKNLSDVLPFDYKSLQGEKQSFSNYILAEQEFYTTLENSDKIKEFKNLLTQKVLAFKKKEDKKRLVLLERIEKAKNYELNKLYGELITANIYKVKKGDKTLNAVNYYDENLGTITIILDENLSPQENAQRYYKKYSKEKKTIDFSKEQIEKVNGEILYANNLLYDIVNAQTIMELTEIEKELISQGFIVKQVENKSQKKSEPVKFLTYEVDGFSILVGKNNLQNEALLSSASRHDLWLHVKDYHSSFVIIKSDGKSPSDKVILTGAEICAYYSEAKNSTKLSVDCTFRKFVKKQPNSRPGSVFYTDYKTYVVNPNNHLDKLK